MNGRSMRQAQSEALAEAHGAARTNAGHAVTITLQSSSGTLPEGNGQPVRERLSRAVPTESPHALHRIAAATRAGLADRRSAENDEEPAAGLALLNDALSAASSRLESDGLERFLETIVEHAVEIVGASAGWFALPSPDESQFELVGAVKRDLRRGGLMAIRIDERMPLNCFAADAWTATKNAADLHWQRLNRRWVSTTMRRIYPRDPREVLRLPVRSGGRTHGMLSLVCGRHGKPDAGAVQAARVLAQQAGLVIGLQQSRNGACESACRSVVDAERARIAGEIHDGVAQAFLAVMMQVRAARLDSRMRDGRVLEFCDQIESAAASGLEEARRSVFALRSIAVERDGLVGALQRLVGSLSGAGSAPFVFVNRAGAPDVAPAVEHAAYRIVQEAAQNALKHAGATLVTVQLERAETGLRVLIEDDGDSVAPEAIQRARERGGLRAMRERAEGCGGRFSVEPRLPRGTRVDVLLPAGGTPP